MCYYNPLGVDIVAWWFELVGLEKCQYGWERLVEGNLEPLHNKEKIQQQIGPIYFQTKKGEEIHLAA